MRISYWSSNVFSSDLPDSPIQREDSHVAGNLGVGVQSTFDKRVAIRAELAYRIDADNDSYAALASDPNHDDGEDWFGDILASVGVVIPLGPAPTAPVAPAQAAPSCADMAQLGCGARWVNTCHYR